MKIFNFLLFRETGIIKHRLNWKFLVLFSCLLSSYTMLWSGGASEGENYRISDSSNSNLSWSLHIQADLGVMNVSIGGDTGLMPLPASACIYLEQAGTVWQLTQSLNYEKIAALPFALRDMSSNTALVQTINYNHSEDLTYSFVKTVSRKEGIPAFTGQIQRKAFVQKAYGLCGFQFPLALNLNSESKIFEGHLYFVLYPESDKQGTAICIKGRREFFKGEEAFFLNSDTKNLSYEEQVFALLFYLFTQGEAGENEQKAYEILKKGLENARSIPDLTKLKTFINQAKDSNRALEIKEALKNCKRSLWNHLLPQHQRGLVLKDTGGQIDIPFFSLSTSNFSSFYSNKPNLYVQIYLGFCAGLNKPLYSRILEDWKEKIAKQELNQNALSLNYNSLRSLNLTEGKELAQKALQYLSWAITSSKVKEVLEWNKLPSDYKNSIKQYVKEDLGQLGESLNKFFESSSYSGDLYEFQSSSLNENSLPKDLLAYMKSPFSIGACSLPYAPYGIDTPRTYVWKLLQILKSPQNASEYRLIKNKNTYSQTPGLDSLGFLGGLLSSCSFSSSFYGFGSVTKMDILKDWSLFKINDKLSVLQNAEGKPDLKPISNEGWIKTLKGVRLSELDLEQTTIIVPSLKLVRPGDILVSWDANSAKNKIGIVVYTDNDIINLNSIEDFFSKVLILGIEENLQTYELKIGYWGKKQNNLKAFSTDPESFSLRRLLIADKEPEHSYAYKDWDFITTRPSGFEGAIEFLQEDYSTDPSWRWIPNTGEYALFKMSLSACFGTANPIGAFSQSLRFLAPQDRFWKSNSNYNSDGNVYTNKGLGFELVGLDLNGNIQNICAFIKNQNPTNQNDAYITAYTWNSSSDTKLVESALYTSSGILKNNCSISTNSQGYICVKTPDFETVYLGIRPLITSDQVKVYPGDDIILRLCLEIDYNDAIKDQQIYILPEHTYLAVYDKKLLWRANLYINETQAAISNSEGKLVQKAVIDWNDKHPWKAPPSKDQTTKVSIPYWWDVSWGYNEWNRVSNKSAVAEDLASLQAGNGGQAIELASWTRFYDPERGVFRNTKQNIDKAVPYTSAGTDSPFEVAWELSEQKKILNHSVLQGLYDYEKSSRGWAETYAPNASWSRYFPNSKNNAAPTWFPAKDFSPIEIDKTMIYPYRPNISAIALYGKFPHASDASNKYAENIEGFVIQSTGVDCSGFTQRCASYLGNSYKLVDIREEDHLNQNDTAAANHNRILRLEGTDGIATDSILFWEDTRKITSPVDLDRIYNDAISKSMVLGDVVLMQAGIKINGVPFYSHVSIVGSIEDLNKDGSITRDEVCFIESASGHDIYKAAYQTMNTQTWWSYRTVPYANEYMYFLKRLIME